MLLDVDDEGDAERDFGAWDAIPSVENVVVELVGTELIKSLLMTTVVDQYKLDPHKEKCRVEPRRGLMAVAPLPARPNPKSPLHIH